MKRLERFEQRGLDEVFGFISSTLEPHGEPEESIQVRQNFGLERSPCAFVDVRT